MAGFHVLVHGRGETGASALATTFDAASLALAELPRMFIEPDGSFVWTGTASDGTPWQVDGNLLDEGASLAYVELKGWCPAEQLDELLAALGWPAQALVFQLPSEGVFIDEADFRRRATGRGG